MTSDQSTFIMYLTTSPDSQLFYLCLCERRDKQYRYTPNNMYKCLFINTYPYQDMTRMETIDLKFKCGRNHINIWCRTIIVLRRRIELIDRRSGHFWLILLPIMYSHGSIRFMFFVIKWSLAILCFIYLSTNFQLFSDKYYLLPLVQNA